MPTCSLKTKPEWMRKNWSKSVTATSRSHQSTTDPLPKEIDVMTFGTGLDENGKRLPESDRVPSLRREAVHAGASAQPATV